MIERQSNLTATNLAALCAATLCLLPLAAQAQQQTEASSRAVVQALPHPATARLTEALRRIAEDPQDVEALLIAGQASLKLSDIDAAIGFFTRARDLGIAGGRGKAGLAAALVYSKKPVEALKLFAEAEREGASPLPHAGDYGLAYDLVGDNARAQQYYRLALGQESDPEILRRLALSQAIGGDQPASEATLLPMLQRGDLASYRTRAFALAALGRTEEAVTIAEAIMPASLASRISPYLRYMPRLTRAQQAAAANFGHFPEASAIGRDDPRIAEYSEAANVGRMVSEPADGRLVPAGEPFGSTRPSPADAAALPAVDAAATRPAGRIELPPEQQRPEMGSAPGLAGAGVQSMGPAQDSGSGADEDSTDAAAVAVVDDEVPGATQATGPDDPFIPAPGFSLAPGRSGEIAMADVADEPAVEAGPGRDNATDSSPGAPQRLSDAFADFDETSESANLAPGAVDVTKIEPARAAPPPARPAHPSRIWVQVATGRDRSALGFDWRRLTRSNSEEFRGRNGFLVRWGQTNRLVTGPFDNREDALAFVNRLKQAGLDTFMFTSGEGEEAVPLASR
ncbi:MAG TPA: SPOR domain-containing protein [Sphingomonadaceae bacterium]|nr:SPOR domain-containing protein [Sphingomonadaceae bacterium]